MRKNSRDELSGAVRNETVAEFRRQEKGGSSRDKSAISPDTDAAPAQAFPNVSKKFIRPLQFIRVHLVHNDAGYEQELSSALWSLSFLCSRNTPSKTFVSVQKSIREGVIGDRFGR